jgi:L-threonine kinase
MLQGEPCLVSCPIAIESCAFLLDEGEAPLHQRRKVRHALAKLAGISATARRIVVQTPLPVGRGFGTSTADIGAALFAASADNGLVLSTEEVARIAVSVEPTDSTLFPV